jgi:predicted transcriptional regulator
LARGEERGKLESAKIMIQDFNLSIKEVSEKLNIPISSLIHLSK